VRPDGLEDNYYFGGGGDTLISPLALALCLLAVILILVLPRKYVVVPFLLAGLLIIVREQVVIAGLHFMIYRILILAAGIRLVTSYLMVERESFRWRLTSLDKCLVVWALSNAIMYTILWREVGALVNRLGFLYTTLGAYFIFRYFIRDREDVIRTIKVLSCVTALIAVVMIAEQLTGKNPLAVFGGVSTYAVVREGRIRAQGPFLHPIIAGTVGATLIPLFIGLWRQGKKNRLAAGIGVVSATLMTITSASSTPMMTYGAGLLALCLWPVRRYMRVFRWGVVLSVITLHLVMKAPVWYLPQRIGDLMGGSGWHRSALLDTFIRRFGEWWLIGTQNNANWGYDMWDAINAYVDAGIEGGLITMLLFSAVLVYAYKKIGAARRMAEPSPRNAFLIWSLGAALFAHTVAFFGITYFDQSAIAWYGLLAMIGITTSFVNNRKRSPAEVQSPDLTADQVAAETVWAKEGPDHVPIHASPLS